MKQIGAKQLYSNVLVTTIALGIVGFILSIYIGDYLTRTYGWFFNPIAQLIPLPPNYQQGSFLAQWAFYGLWALFSALVLTLLFRRGGSGQTGNSKFGSSRSRNR